MSVARCEELDEQSLHQFSEHEGPTRFEVISFGDAGKPGISGSELATVVSVATLRPLVGSRRPRGFKPVKLCRRRAKSAALLPQP